MTPTTSLKLMVIGDGAVGKTCMLIRLVEDDFPGEYIPTVFDNYSLNAYFQPKSMLMRYERVPSGEGVQYHMYTNSFPEPTHVDTKKDKKDTAKEDKNSELKVALGLWDTGGRVDYARLRPLSYPQTDVFLLCFDTANRQSIDSIPTMWIPEVTHHCPDVPLLLVGMKTDLRAHRLAEDPLDARVVSSSEGKRLAAEIGACGYRECSALDSLSSVEEVFLAAVGLVFCGSDPSLTKKRKKREARAFYRRSNACVLQ
jgi:Ras-related C3 botulinum toxin substrate 1